MLYYEFFPYDEVFSNGKRNTIINHIPSLTSKELSALNDIVMKSFDRRDILEPIPSCNMGCTTGGYNLGVYCKKCDSFVIKEGEDNTNLGTWILPPDGVEYFIAPQLWTMMGALMSIKGTYNITEYFASTIDPPDNVPLAVNRAINYLENIGWERGYNPFINNFDDLMKILPDIAPKRYLGEKLSRVFEINRDRLFVKALPLPIRTTMILESSAVSKKAELNIGPAMNAVRICTAYTNSKNMSLTKRQRSAMLITANMSEYMIGTFRKTFESKKKWLRGKTIGTRANFSFMSVITSIHEAHQHDEIHIAWPIAIETFRVHILNHLLNVKGYSMRYSQDLINSARAQYVEEIGEIMDKIIGEGYPATLIRYPTMRRTAKQLFKIKKVIKRMTYVIKISVLSLYGPNSDFDGDYEIGRILISLEEVGEFLPLEPHYGTPNIMTLKGVSGDTDLPAVTVLKISSYVEESLDRARALSS